MIASMIGKSSDEPGLLDSFTDSFGKLSSALGFYNGLQPDEPPANSLREAPITEVPEGSCGVPMGPITGDIAQRLTGLEEFASPEELDRLGFALQGIKESTSCVDISAMGEASDTVLDDFTEIAKAPVGRELIDEVSEDPEGNRVGLEPIPSGSGPGTSSADDGAYRFFHSVEGQCVPMSNSIPTGGNARIRYSPGENVGWGVEQVPWMPYPAHVALFHELVHALHIQNGTNEQVKGSACTEGGRSSDIAFREENRTTGVGGYKERFTENTYREQRRALGDDLPHRDYYYSPSNE